MEKLSHSIDHIVNANYTLLTTFLNSWGNSPSFKSGGMTKTTIKKETRKFFKQQTNRLYDECPYLNIQLTLDGYIMWLKDMKKENPNFGGENFNPYEFLGKFEHKYLGFVPFEPRVFGNEEEN
tara:strand:+ start:328 stop:696 length:369 start_codon:yes stop_codon:yes gene_type:complete